MIFKTSDGKFYTKDTAFASQVWPHCKSKIVVLTSGSHVNTIIRRVIFNPLMYRLDFNSGFDSDVGSK